MSETPKIQEITVLGQTNFRGQARVFGIYEEDRRGHVYVLGKTGMGKTTLLRNMLVQDIQGGKAVALVDPHGDLASELLAAVPSRRLNDVIYFDPSDVAYPVGFNVLETPKPEYKYLVASGLIGTLKKIWADSWGPRLEYILRNTILALLDYPGATMLGISRMLTDKKYRERVVRKIQDPVVRSFWVNEFANYNERFANEAISPIQNKVGQFLSSAVIRNIVSQPKSTIDIHDIMDNGKVLIMNLSKGKIGEDNSALLGAMMITRIQLAAMDRAYVPESERTDFFLYVDEFQNFATESFAGILSEARKYRLNLVIAHQYITQMEEPVRDAVFGNVGTIVAYRVGAFDAEYLEKEFAPYFVQSDLVNLDRYSAYIRLMIHGVTSKPFSMKNIPPTPQSEGNAETVLRVSRERYARPRDIVEDKILRWSSNTEPKPVKRTPTAAPLAQKPVPTQPAQPAAPAKLTKAVPAPFPAMFQTPVGMAESEPPEPGPLITDLASTLAEEDRKRGQQKTQDRIGKKMYDTLCDRCGKATQVPFQPTPGRPVYCPECFAIVKAGIEDQDSSMQG